MEFSRRGFIGSLLGIRLASRAVSVGGEKQGETGAGKSLPQSDITLVPGTPEFSIYVKSCGSSSSSYSYPLVYKIIQS